MEGRLIKEKYTVNIVLPVYNGEKYLKEQIDSILNQSYSNIRLFVRDDMSKDDSIKILNDNYKSKLTFMESSENLGVIGSFFELLSNSGESDFYALADQDDVWKKTKIEKAVSTLSKLDRNIPLLYCAAVDVVDEQLNYKGKLSKREKGPSFENSLVQNIATGCTIVMNKAARDLIVFRNLNYKNLVMHDWWFYLVVTSFGEVIYDKESVMYYRQHNNNTFGSGYGSIQRWYPRIKRFFKTKEAGQATKQLKEFYGVYKDELEEDKRNLIEKYLNSRESFFERVKFSFSGKVFRQNFMENISCHILMILNKW